jgi:biotin-(acetyl-CoA carboxylase) ligase
MISNDTLFVDGKIVQLQDLKQIAIDFIDNAGGKDKNGNVCNWCEGKQLASSSEHPSKAIISIKADRAANYETYISVLDNLNAAYTKLRNQLSVKRYNQHYTGLMEDFKKSNHKEVSIQAKIKDIREKYPLLLSDIEINN